VSSQRQLKRTSLLLAAAAGAAAAALSALGSVGLATYLARRVLTPDRLKPDDIEILAVHEDSVTLRLTSESAQPGRYGLWFEGGHGHARVGAVLETDEGAGFVRRVPRAVEPVLLRGCPCGCVGTAVP